MVHLSDYSVKTLFNCRLCKSKSLKVLWDLNPSPYGDLFCDEQNKAKTLAQIKLTLQMCDSCKFVQLGEEVNIDEIYRDYLYNSSITPGLPSFYNRLSSRLICSLNLNSSDLVIDIGSNDGTALVPFKEKGFKVVGVEPAIKPAEKANSNGITTINSYLSEDTVSEVLSKFGQAHLVMANYVSSNVPDPVEFFKLIKSLIHVDGVISIVTGYHPDQFSINMFEYINHDHLSYFSVSSALVLADLAGLKLISAEKIEHKGGSIHFIFKSSETLSESQESINQLAQREYWMRIDKLSFYDDFKNRVEVEKLKCRKLLPESGLVGIGASISTTHLLHQFEIGNRFDLLLDDDLNKINKFSPGFGIKVQALNSYHDDSRNFVTILAWQHSKILLRKYRELNQTAKILIPLPFNTII